MFESVIGLFPIWLAVFGLLVALFMPIIQSCRTAAREQAGQAPPLSDVEHADP